MAMDRAPKRSNTARQGTPKPRLTFFKNSRTHLMAATRAKHLTLPLIGLLLDHHIPLSSSFTTLTDIPIRLYPHEQIDLYIQSQVADGFFIAFLFHLSGAGSPTPRTCSRRSTDW